MTGSIYKRFTGTAVLCLAALWLAATPWVRSLSLPDEGRYVGIAWEMLRSGDWLVPTLDGLPYFHKPPLFYWITGASLSVFGANEWAGRMAPLLGALAGAVALYRFALRWAGESSAKLSLLVLLTQPLFFVSSQFANLDMLVAGCISVSVLAAAHALLQAQQGHPSPGALALAYLFAALGLLAKGLIGVVLPGMVILCWLLALRRWRQIASLLWLPGIALFLCVAAPWFIAMQWRFPAFADYFFVVQHFKRFAQSGFNNVQPFWFYPVVLALLTLPWFAWLPAAGRRRYWSHPQRGPIRQLMWVWLVVVTLFFSLPQSKLVGYIVPTVVPLAFLIGDSAGSSMTQSLRLRRLWQFSAALAIAACLTIIATSEFHSGKSLRKLGHILAGQTAPQDSVVFLNDYFFDVPFYAGLRAPVRVVEDWGNSGVALRDNWRKELLDAQRFAPASATPVLLRPTELADTLCGATTTWIIGHWTASWHYPELTRGTAVAREGETVLWRMPGRQAGSIDVSVAACPEKPSANSIEK